MTQYEALDRLILNHIALHASPHPLYARLVCKEAVRIAELTGRKEFRVIDGRLVALRKAGKIVADRATRSWRIAT